ncbi:MAG: ATP-binding protein [Cyanobacteriota bacterium]|nr:ATP-binding protein [Cyanobacteriota bacterium]
MESLTVSGRLTSLEAIAHYVLNAAAQAGLNRKATYRLRLAVDELVTNIITHGYAEAQQQGDISLHAKIDERSLRLSIEDTGIFYDPTQTETQTDRHLPPEQRNIGGWGVYLTQWGIDELKYERDRGRNRNILVVHRHSNGFESLCDRDWAV